MTKNMWINELLRWQFQDRDQPAFQAVDDVLSQKTLKAPDPHIIHWIIIKLNLLAVAASLAGLVAAQGLDDAEFSLEERATSSAETADFDDLTPSPLAVINFVPVPYKYLNFSAFVFQSAGTGGVGPGVIPNSLPNYAANGVVGRTRAGNPTFTITGTNATSFDLKSFFYGCYITQPLEQVQVSTSCSLSVVGIKTNGQTLPPRILNFLKQNSLTAEMEEATFDSTYTKLATLRIEPISAFPSVLTTSLVVDTVKYIVYGI